MMIIKKPNVIIVFSNMYPDTRWFTKDRWLIFKINKKMMLQEVTEQKVKNKEEEEEVNDEKTYIKYWKNKSVYDRMTR